MRRGHGGGSQEVLGTKVSPCPGLGVRYYGVVVGTKTCSGRLVMVKPLRNGVIWAHCLSSQGFPFPWLLVGLNQDFQPSMMIKS